MLAVGNGNAMADRLSADPIMRRDPSRTADDQMARRGGTSQVRRAPTSAGLYEVLDLILDKGIVVDAFVRVSLVGIELLTVDLRVVIASVDTYLRYAEGIERLNVRGDERSEPANLPGMVNKGMRTRAMSKGAKSIGSALTGGDDDDAGEGGGVAGVLTRGVKSIVGRVTGEDDDDSGDEGNARPQKGNREERARPPRRDENAGRQRSIGARR